MYTAFGGNIENLKKENINIFSDMAIVDEQTGDKYVCRSTDYTYLKYVKDQYLGEDTVKVYQTCIVFPPLGKRVKEVYIGRAADDGRYTRTFNLNNIPRKGRVITK